MRAVWFSPLLALCLVFASAPVRAANEGQADLDEATEAKLSAENLEDLGNVIKLAQRALEKGLDDSNKAFANELLAASLLQRATIFSQQIFDRNPPNQNWANYRQMAVSDLEQAIAAQSELEMAHRLLARLLMLPGGDRERARKAIDESVRLAADEPESKAKALAMRAALSNKPDEQLNDLNEAVRLVPGDIEVLRARGQVLLAQGKLAEALQDFERALEIDPEDVDSLNAVGMTLTLEKKFDEALAQFDRLVELAPESPVARLQRARVYAAQKAWEKALVDVNEALRLEPNLPAALLVRSGIHQEQGDRAAALADLEVLIKARPDAADVRLLHAQIAAQGGLWGKAIEDFEQLRKIAPQSNEVGVQLARFYTAAKQPRKAIAIYDELLAKDPKSWQSLRGRADAYLNIGKHSEAVTDYEAATKIKPDDQEMLNNFAWVLATSPKDEVRNGKRSIELATQAAELSKFQAAHILSTLAAAYAEAGDFDRAKEWSQKAVDVGKSEGRLEDQLGKELASYEEKKPWRELQEVAEAEAPVDDPSVAVEPAASQDDADDNEAKDTPATNADEAKDKPDAGADQTDAEKAEDADKPGDEGAKEPKPEDSPPPDAR
ncbi:MAG: tetratricopeptide repeat protein [Pirellulales bacterium]